MLCFASSAEVCCRPSLWGNLRSESEPWNAGIEFAPDQWMRILTEA